MPTVSKTKKRIVSLFGALGYFSLIIQWCWTMVIFLPLLLRSDVKSLFVPDQTVHHTQAVATLGGPAILWTIVGIIVTVIIVIVSAVVLIRLPLKIVQSGEKITHQTAKAVLPVITHQKQLPPARQKRLTAQLVKYIKFAACLLPVCLLLGVFFIDSPLPREIVITVGCALGIGSLTWFSIEYLLARWFNVPLEKVL